MFKKILIIMAIASLFLLSCKKRERTEIQITERGSPMEEVMTMQDIADGLDGDIQDLWSDPYEDIEEIAVTPPPPITQTTPPPQTTTTPRTPTTREPERGEYTAQLMSSRDHSRVEEVRRLLAASAYFTEIVEVDIDGVTWYRLRLAGSFSRSYADYLGNKIKSEFREVTDHWVTRR